MALSRCQLSPLSPSSQWRQPSLDEHLELGDIKADLAGFRSTWTKHIQENKQKWKERAASGRGQRHQGHQGHHGHRGHHGHQGHHGYPGHHGHHGHRGGAGDHHEPRRASSGPASPEREMAQGRLRGGDRGPGVSPVTPGPVSPPGITNQASIDELSPCEDPATPGAHRENGDVE